jgi:hypothetical protein
MIRNLSELDRPQIESWIAAEPSHASNTFDWYNEAGTKSVVFEDESGAVLVAKFTPCLRIDIDFNPTADRVRVGGALAQGLAEIVPIARKQGFREFVFESLSEKLSAFCGHLGFRKSPDYTKSL